MGFYSEYFSCHTFPFDKEIISKIPNKSISLDIEKGISSFTPFDLENKLFLDVINNFSWDYISLYIDDIFRLRQRNDFFKQILNDNGMYGVIHPKDFGYYDRNCSVCGSCYGHLKECFMAMKPYFKYKTTEELIKATGHNNIGEVIVDEAEND